MFMQTLAPEEDGREKVKAAGRGQQVHPSLAVSLELLQKHECDLIYIFQ